MIIRFTDGRPSIIACDVPECEVRIEFREPASLFEMGRIIRAAHDAHWTTANVFEGKRDYCPGHNPIITRFGMDPEGFVT